MRLIDADKLEVKHFVQRTEKIIGYDGTQPRYELKDVLAYAIDDAPTVKAIPTGWISEYSRKPLSNADYWAIMRMVTAWEKENEID